MRVFDGCCFFSCEPVQLEILARSHVRYPPLPVPPSAGRHTDNGAALGGSPLEISLIQATHDKLRSVGANTIVLQGQPTAVFVPLSSGSPSCPV